VVVTRRDWHPGVVGLVASRLKERFRRPAFAIASAARRGQARPARFPASISAARARGGRGRAAGQGRRPRHGGGADCRARAARRFRAFLEERLATRWRRRARPTGSTSTAALTARGATHRCAEADRAGRAIRRRRARAGLRAAAPPHRATCSEVGEAHLRVTAEAGDGASLTPWPSAPPGAISALSCASEARRRAHLAGHLSGSTVIRGEERPQFRLIDAADPALSL
jgi:single-stranded-DNA-specific exonuclease